MLPHEWGNYRQTYHVWCGDRSAELTAEARRYKKRVLRFAKNDIIESSGKVV